MNRLSQSQINERNREFAAGRVWCVDCNAFRPVGEFWKMKPKAGNRFENFGYRYYCKKCDFARRDKAKARKNYLKMRENNIDKLVEMTGGKCQFPGCEYDNPLILEFHHVNPAEKEGSPKAMAITKIGFNKAIDEANKCCLLCPNHHAEIEVGIYFVNYKRRVLEYSIESLTILEDRIIKRNGACEGNEENTPPADTPQYRKTPKQPELW